ncbi:hypothetical protein GCM10010520_11870 [Rhizobium viscosum]|uniref:Uncharacterized protein n=1 Tax=Rhizobium viscosum TaxID=1673 RepID=A0ABR9IYX0_RHIVS|nr:hypothetical protein [Rhizobium viscosum]MBE1508268.1 hypothetical protein [Rhizobium viscosum]
MPDNDLSTKPVDEIGAQLPAMTDEEIFGAMRWLETNSESAAGSDRQEVLARIVLIEEEIERRFPGQVLAPYRDWMKNHPLL